MTNVGEEESAALLLTQQCCIRNTDQGLTRTCPKAKPLKEHNYGAVLKIASGSSAFETRGLGCACLEHHQEVLEAQGRASLLPCLPPSLPLCLLLLDWSTWTGAAAPGEWTEQEVGGGTWLHSRVLRKSDQKLVPESSLKSPLELSFVILGLGPGAEASFFPLIHPRVSTQQNSSKRNDAFSKTFPYLFLKELEFVSSVTHLIALLFFSRGT